MSRKDLVKTQDTLFIRSRAEWVAFHSPITKKQERAIKGIQSTCLKTILGEDRHKNSKIIPSQMEVAPLHCTVDITQKRRLFKNTKETEKM